MVVDRDDRLRITEDADLGPFSPRIAVTFTAITFTAIIFINVAFTFASVTKFNVSLTLKISISETKDVPSGSPQGSCLSPILYIIQIADVDLWVGGSIHGYADDSTSSSAAPTISETLAKQEEDAKGVLMFMNSNMLVANTDKTKTMMIGGSGEESVQIGHDTIPVSNTEKLLGMEVSADLSWSKHIEKVRTELLSRLCIIRRLSTKLPNHALKIIADGLFQSKVRYGACLYVRPLINEDEKHAGEIQKLQVIQNELNRVLMGVRRSDKIRNKDLREMTGLQTINQIAASQALQELRKIVVDGSVPELQAALLDRIQSNSHKTRATSDFKLTAPLSNNRDFLSGAVKLWNAAPQDLRDSRTSPTAFRRQARSFVATLP